MPGRWPEVQGAPAGSALLAKYGVLGHGGADEVACIEACARTAPYHLLRSLMWV